MASRKSTSEAMTQNKDLRFRWAAPALCSLLIAGSFSTTGCQRFPGSQAMRQYQLESDRLLAEYRAQKKRADELEVTLSREKQKTAEAEKLLAQTLGGSRGRSTAGNSRGSQFDSELMIGDARGDSSPGSSLSDAKSSRSSTRGPVKINRGGLPDTLPSTSGLLTSGSRTDPLSLGNGPRDLKGDPKSDSQWRPVNRGK